MIAAPSAALLEAAAAAIGDADALLVTAGAGMGVDSGLPDFRGNDGFWNAYPPYRHLGLSFIDLANPRWFDQDPQLAWGFYGHRLNLYRATRPHDGFATLRAWAAAKPFGGFVFTSNVDGQFQRAGFDADRVVECHGAIDSWQCARPCGDAIWPAPDGEVTIDPTSLRANAPLPQCAACGAPARPNVLMFDDADWIADRTLAQQARFDAWLARLPRDRGRGRVAIIECGAGRAIPTVRRLGESLADDLGARLIRINVREPEVPRGALGIAARARPAIDEIDRLLRSRRTDRRG